MAFDKYLKKIEGVKSIRFADPDDKYTDPIPRSEFSKIKAPFDLVLRFKHNGRRYNRTMKFRSGRTLTKAVEAARAEITRLKEEGPGERPPTYEEAMNAYLESRAKAMSPRNAQNYRMMLSKHLPHIKDKRVDKVRPEHLQSAVNAILDSGGAPRTAKAVQDYTRPVFEFAIGKGWIERNPAKDIRLPKFDNKRYFEIDEESAKRLYRAIVSYDDELYRQIFVWLLHGRRLNEVLSLRWEHINFQMGTYEIVAEHNKARKAMRYPLTDMQRRNLPRPFGKAGLIWRGKKTGQKLNREMVRRHWKHVTTSAGIVGMRLHDLRHLYGYLAVNVLGLPLEAIAATLGHTSTQITARYANVRMKTVESATDSYFKLLEGEL